MNCRKTLITWAIVTTSFVMPALADVKTGIDAYQRGDFASAVGVWRPLADAGDADAQYNIGQAYRLGRGVPADPLLAESWFRKAADQGHERARNAYGLTLFQNGRRQEAIPYIEESAGNNFPQSQYVFATLLFNGDLVEKDWVRSYALMTRAAAGNVTAATAGLQQLDQFIPLEQRQRGLKLAQVFAGAADKGLDPVATPMTVATELPARVKSTPTQSAIKSPVGNAVMPIQKPAISGHWRVQLGAFGKSTAGPLLWTQLKSRISALTGYETYMVPAGAVTRLQAGPLASHAAAERLCALVKAAGNACLVIAP